MKAILHSVMKRCFCPLSFLLLVGFLPSIVLGQELVINEFMAANDGIYLDEDGDASDWVELLNTGSTSISLENYGISDDLDNPFKWVFPPQVIEPGEYLLMFCSGKDRISEPYLHSNFKISSEGEDLILTDPSGAVLDFIKATPCSEGYAVARLCQETCYNERVTTPSPSMDNNLTSNISFSQQSGAYALELEVTLVHSLADEIRYTLDGSEPRNDSPVYTGPLVMTDLAGVPASIATIPTSYNWSMPSGNVRRINVIRARAFSDGLPSSATYSKTYLIGEEVASAYQGYPIVSLMTDSSALFDYDTGIFVQGVHYDSSDPIWTGNYYEKGPDWEREMQMEFFVNGDLSWSQGVGMRIHGGRTRGYPQKTMRIYSRGEQGAPKFNHQLFDTKDKNIFDKFLLRTPNGCWNKTAIKDDVTAYIGRNLDFEFQHSQPVVVFINGEYWGLFSIRDYLDSSFLEEESEFDKDSVNLLLHGSGTRPGQPIDWGIVEGDNDSYLAMLDFVENNDLSIPQNYLYASSIIDINSMIDYYCLSTFFIKKDWPTGNSKVWQGSDSAPWRWLSYDFDSGWGYLGPSHNTILHAFHPTGDTPQNPPYATVQVRSLFESQAFTQAFLKRYACLLRHDFSVDTVDAAIDRFVSMYSPGMEEELNRWNELGSVSQWNSQINSSMRNFIDQRHANVINHISDYFEIDFDPSDYDCELVDVSPVGIADWSDTMHSVHVYPSPASDIVWIDCATLTNDASIVVYDMSGREVLRDAYSKHYSMQVSNWDSGVYTVRISAAAGDYAGRIVVN